MRDQRPRVPAAAEGPEAGSETTEIRLSGAAAGSGAEPQPGLVVVYAGWRPMCRAFIVGREPLVLGREALPAGVPLDTAMSRRHTSVAHDGRAWVINDLGSRNGTSLDGAALEGQRIVEAPRVLRIGHTVCIFVADVRPFLALGGRELQAADGAMVIGPRLAEVWRFITLISGGAKNLHIRGESGTGKELVAHAFHDHSPQRSGPFIAVNCAAIPPNLAERLLFGARKGAFSGADTDSEGYLQAADGGTLFLDEIGELEATLQAKLLRVLETREVLALGATKPKKVDLRVCSATHRDLRALVDDGRFRQDLYFRLSRPDVSLPPLRDRPEEIAYHVRAAVHAAGTELEADATLVEACLLRTWPGNVREVLIEVTQAAQVARVKASSIVIPEHLHAEAGRGAPAVHTPEKPDKTDRPDKTEAPAESTSTPLPPREAILEALRAADGRVATAARQLGVPRIRLRRWLQREGIAPDTEETEPG